MFGFVEVLRDSKAMTAKKSVASAKIIQHTKLFGGCISSFCVVYPYSWFYFHNQIFRLVPGHQDVSGAVSAAVQGR